MEYQSNLLLKDTTLRLRTYSGESVKIMGFCYVTVQYYGKSKELPINVTALEDVLSKHASVFSEGLGTKKNIQTQIQTKESAQPRFWKARPIASACKPAVDEALRELDAD